MFSIFSNKKEEKKAEDSKIVFIPTYIPPMYFPRRFVEQISDYDDIAIAKAGRGGLDIHPKRFISGDYDQIAKVLTETLKTQIYQVGHDLGEAVAAASQHSWYKSSDALICIEARVKTSNLEFKSEVDMGGIPEHSSSRKFPTLKKDTIISQEDIVGFHASKYADGRHKEFFPKDFPDAGKNPLFAKAKDIAAFISPDGAPPGGPQLV